MAVNQRTGVNPYTTSEHIRSIFAADYQRKSFRKIQLSGNTGQLAEPG